VSENREQRAGKNEALFRSINERIAAGERQGTNGGRITFLCECSYPDCVRRIALTPAAYEKARADARDFIVAPGHRDDALIEHAVDEGDGYVVVRKHDEASSIAEETDPRG
jgi:hypothetical protein